MDCDAARLFLQFVSPGGSDLDGPEAAELNEHLAHCSTCNALALDQKRLDQMIGRAMRAVEVPRDLREHLLQSLERNESSFDQRWPTFTRLLVAAAAVLVGISLWYTFSPPRLVTITADSVLRSYNYSRPGPLECTEQLRQLGQPLLAPEFNFAYLVGFPSLAILPGTQHEDRPIRVPQLVFAKDRDHAIVYILDSRRYQVEELDSSQAGYHYSLALHESPDQPGIVYLVLHTGKSWDWLRLPAVSE